VVLPRLHQDHNEDHPADEQPDRPAAKDSARALEDRHGNPSF
jgi:hypothetical protein